MLALPIFTARAIYRPAVASVQWTLAGRKKEPHRSAVLWLPLLDSLFCGKATPVATVHRTVAKSRLSSPPENGSQIKKETTPFGVISWLPLLDSNQRPAD